MAKFSEIRIQRVPESDKLQLELIARNEGFKSVNELVRHLINEKLRQADTPNHSDDRQTIEEQYIHILNSLSEVKIKQDIMLLKLDN